MDNWTRHGQTGSQLLLTGVAVEKLHFSGRWVNEFYKKGCQEKSSASTGGSRFFLEIQPTLFRYL
jgi:hypothetical protein